MEPCVGAHHLSRQLKAYSHDVDGHRADEPGLLPKNPSI
jgi:hypothetical protein